MSSTTDRRADQGQILVLFAGAIAVVMLVAALAFDVGMMLVERRDQQNAADAAALAGARFSLSSGDYHGSCAGAPAGNKAVKAACDLAAANGFDASLDNEDVTVHIPPRNSRVGYNGVPGFVEVDISTSRASIFGGIIGQALWPVGSIGIAANQPDLSFPFSMLALSESGCKAMLFSGAGVVEAYGNIHSNSSGSDCTGDPVSLSRTGGATVNIYADDATCRAAGSIQDQGSGSMTCTQAPNSFVLPDPLRRLTAPAKPALAPAMKQVGHTTAIPDRCPGATGSKAPKETQTQTCVIGLGGAANKAWIMYPGLYPAGIDIKGGSTVYLMPGIYWIGGGGFATENSGSVITIAAEASAPTTTAAGGIMIYNSKLPTSAGGPISLGGSGATLKLKPLDVAPENPDHIYNDIVIFQDRTVTAGVTLNGSASVAEVEGLIYVPAGLVTLNGNGGTLLVDQIIADSYKVNGDNGTLKILRRTGVDAVISGAGLVE